MSEFGWIKLHRRITEWQHWNKPNVLATFIHLLTLANYEPKEWNGIVVQRGQLVTSERNFAEEVGVARSTLRRVLLLLQETGEIEMEIVTVGDRKGCTLITVLNYNEYQGDLSTFQANSGWTTSDTKDFENREPQAIPWKSPINTSISQQQTDDGEPRGQTNEQGGADHTKEYIKNNIYISTSSSARARVRVKGENENFDESERKNEPQTNRLNTETGFEERKKVAAKKERSEYQEMKRRNEAVISEIKNNSEWVADTARLFSTSVEDINAALLKFGLYTTTTHKPLQLPDTYAHFQLWMNHEIREKPRVKPQPKPKQGAVSDFWSSPEAKAIEERNRREGEELMKKYKINEI